MTSPAANPWLANWTIVRADLDIEHVMMPLSNFRLENASAAGSPPTYRIMHNAGTPSVDCFCGAILRPAGTDTASFSDITAMSELPTYGDDAAAQYIRVSELMGTYLTRHTTVQRLEGQIRIPPAAAPAAKSFAPHAVIPTTVQLYQFGNVVQGGLPLLVVRAPLLPQTPTNGDGTALGLGRS